jgi:hypothetical protein
MEQSLNLPNRYAMILDTEMIKSVVAHAAELKLPRRECHPLDRYHGRCANATLAKYDAEVDATLLAKDELDDAEAAIDAVQAAASENADYADDDF